MISAAFLFNVGFFCFIIPDDEIHVGSVSDYLVFHFSAKRIDSQIGFCRFSHDYFLNYIRFTFFKAPFRGFFIIRVSNYLV